MEVTIRHIEGKAFEASSRGHSVICDQPMPAGQDRGMTPPELFLSALGSCAMHYALEYLLARRMPHQGLQVKVTADKGGSPTRLTALAIAVSVPGLDPVRQAGLRAAVHSCLLHQTLLHVSEIAIEIAIPELAAA